MLALWLAVEEFILFICIADEQHMTWRFYFSPVLAMSQCCQVWSLGSPSNSVVLPVPQGLLTTGNRLSASSRTPALVVPPGLGDWAIIRGHFGDYSLEHLEFMAANSSAALAPLQTRRILGLSKPLTMLA